MLSGGERQRIAIARAFLKRAPILILDEATSNLDSYSESLVQRATELLMSGKTTFLVAHRFTMVRKADQIYVLQGGQIVEVGSHEGLIEKQGLYRKLFDQQATDDTYFTFSSEDLGGEKSTLTNSSSPVTFTTLP